MAGFPKAGDEYGGRYRIVRQIGHGGMGSVYEAVDKVLNRPVALKIVLPSLGDREDYQARFAREASVLARIRSRHIVGIHEYGEDDDTVFFVTELFPDGDLQTWLARNGPLERKQALTLVAQVCEALADAHAADVIHRDVKPGNVLLWSRAEGLIPYLCDFGIAIDGQKGLTRTGTLVGSPAYMAPERHFGHAADERGDLYSVGCLLWAALTGDAPYSGTDFQMMNAHINEATPQLGTGHPVDEQIDEVLAESLQKDPARRIPSASEMRRRLLAIVADMEGRVPPAPLAAPASPLVSDPGTKPRAFVPPAADDAEPEPTPPRTVVRDAIVPAVAPKETAAVAPEPAVDEVVRVERDGGGRHGGGLWVIAALLVLLVVGGTAWAIAAGSDDREPTAGEPTSSASPTTDPSAEPTTDPTPTAEPLARPKPPRLSAEPGYRSVLFAIDPPRASKGLEQQVEYRTRGGWREARSRVRVPTRQGGDRGCLTVRTVATDAEDSATSRTTRACGRAAPRTVALVRRAADPCVNSQGGPCTWYDVRVAGFAGRATPVVEVRRLDGSSFCAPYTCDFDRIRIGEDGRGYLRHDWKISRDEGRVLLDVAGVTGIFHVYY